MFTFLESGTTEASAGGDFEVREMCVSSYDLAVRREVK